MRKLFILILLPFLGFTTYAQSELDGAIGAAETAYASGNLDDARFKLMQVMEELDKTIAKNILDELPEKMGNMVPTGEDEYTGNVTGFTGLYIHRRYENPSNPEESVEFTLLNDSPLMAGVNAFLNAPIIGGLTGTGRKRIKVDGYKGSLQKSEGYEDVYDVNFPFGQSLLTLNFIGEKDENTILGMVNTIPIGKIAQAAQ
ncbi:MAG: hypothetical protein AAF694_09895 [Bacteroidota bacterium]